MLKTKKTHRQRTVNDSKEKHEFYFLSSHLMLIYRMQIGCNNLHDSAWQVWSLLLVLYREDNHQGSERRTEERLLSLQVLLCLNQLSEAT